MIRPHFVKHFFQFRLLGQKHTLLEHSTEHDLSVGVHPDAAYLLRAKASKLAPSARHLRPCSPYLKCG